MWIVAFVVAFSLGISGVIIFVTRHKAEKQKIHQEFERESHARQKELSETAGVLCEEIRGLLRVLPNLNRATTLSHTIEIYRYKDGDGWGELNRIVINFSFTGSEDDFRLVKERHIKSGIQEFQKKNPNVYIRLTQVHQPIAG